MSGGFGAADPTLASWNERASDGMPIVSNNLHVI